MSYDLDGEITRQYVERLQIPDTCPKCRRDLRAGEIPGDQRTGLETHYSHIIAIYDRGRDRTVAWRCPFCGHEWRRNEHDGA